LKPANSLPLRIGDWRVDPGVDEITRDGAVVKLEPRAMRLLLCLAERAGQVVSVEELLDEVWADVVVTSDSVYQAVAALRRILGDHAKEPAYIATLPRRGYRLVASVAAWSEPASARPFVPPLTPIVDTPPTAPPTAPTYWSLRWERALFLIGLTLIIGYLIIGQAWRSRQPVAPVSTAAQVSFSDKSIAVLPFVDMSQSKDQEYFADGMAEEVIDLLAKIPGIKVIGRTSSFQFKGKSDDLRTIGTALSAAYVVEGSVRKSGDRLRVTAQLIGARDGSHLWSETYDKSAGDVLRVQDQIAVGLVRALQVAVGADDLQTSPALESTEAYDLYLRGREVNQRYDRQGFEAAIGYFQQALEIDPTSERAALELALAQNALAIWGFVPPREGFERARQSAKRALKLNPQSGLAHGILASIHSVYDWDWQSADRESALAVTLEPRSSMVLGLAGMAYSRFRWDESARLLSASLVLDPLNAAWWETLGNIRYREGRLSEAEAELRKALELSPTYGGAHFYLGQILLAEGKREAALEEMPQEAPESGRDTGLAIIYHAIGRKGDSDAALARLTTDRASDAAYEIAEAHAFRGEIDEAFAWLNRAYQQKDVELFTIKGDPLLKTLEPDPRYKAFMRKMNLSK
jgi:TolB-like protein/DNA-binding winged helix-turn-helix (wHTH) protein